ncbi:cingulin [Iris pallida]|uniref:Cingulin n=1 Tax=Iris pallida TaxID=29817 RepID=A0AAX6EZU8_IRIPA|nr:cingulin [Iris pallida]
MDDGGSLFEGMVLFSPLDDLSSSSSSSSYPPPPPPPPPPPQAPDSPPPIPIPEPLDEDLFSDLTLQSLTPEEKEEEATLLPPPPPPTTTSRQTSSCRKKKKAVRIGYGRNSSSSSSLHVEPEEEEVDLPPPPASPTPRSIPDQQQHQEQELVVVVEQKTQTQAEQDQQLDDDDHLLRRKKEENSTSQPEEDGNNKEKEKEKEKQHQQQQMGRVISWKEDAPLSSIEDKLRLFRSRISEEHDRIRQTASSLSLERKDLGRRRRKAMGDLNLASAKFKDLERQLEEACEAEDFETAERLSDSLAAAEKDKDALLADLRDAEAECDALDLKMQELLGSQIAAEEQGVTLLQQFAKDAAEYAELVLKNAEDISSKRLEEWQSAVELLEVNKIEVDIESHLISEARSGLENSVEHLVEDDRKKVDSLRIKRNILANELDDLLDLVRLKEAEIAENDSQIQAIDEKISNVINEFHGTQSSIDMTHNNLQLALSKIESETEALAIKKKDIDEFILLAQNKSSKLRELSNISLDEAKTCQDLVGLRKSVASSILKSREDKVELAKSEETILVEIQILKQQTSAARNTLQELSSVRANIQQEVGSLKQRIDFIDKRGPELEAEKKVAAAARNFKEAGRIAAEAKALNVEKETLQSKREKAVSDIEQLEEEIKGIVDKIHESEGLVLLKEKEAAMAGCKRLRLVAAAARAERTAALEMGDTEEGEILLKEAAVAESKARDLQETYDLEPEEEHEKTLGHFVSITLITNLAGKHLAEMAASFNLPSVDVSQL